MEINPVISSDDPCVTWKVFVGGFEACITDEDLQEVFSAYGPVKEGYVVRRTNTNRGGQSRRFGFVVFEDEESFDKVLFAKTVDVKGKSADIRCACVPFGKAFPTDGFLHVVANDLSLEDGSVTEEDLKEFFLEEYEVTSPEVEFEKVNARPSAQTQISHVDTAQTQISLNHLLSGPEVGTSSPGPSTPRAKRNTSFSPRNSANPPVPSPPGSSEAGFIVKFHDPVKAYKAMKKDHWINGHKIELRCAEKNSACLGGKPIAERGAEKGAEKAPHSKGSKGKKKRSCSGDSSNSDGLPIRDLKDMRTNTLPSTRNSTRNLLANDALISASYGVPPYYALDNGGYPYGYAGLEVSNGLTPSYGGFGGALTTSYGYGGFDGYDASYYGRAHDSRAHESYSDSVHNSQVHHHTSPVAADAYYGRNPGHSLDAYLASYLTAGFADLSADADPRVLSQRLSSRSQGTPGSDSGDSGTPGERLGTPNFSDKS